MTDNKCHSYSRFNCYLNKSSRELNHIELKTTKAHLFKDAVSCAFKVLSSSLVKFSYFYYLIVIIEIILL